MKFLKRVGIDLLKFVSIVAGYQPIIQEAAAGLPASIQSELALFTNIIQTVEGGVEKLKAAGTSITGAQKAVIAAPAISQVILSSLAMAGKEVADPVAFDAACVKLAGDWADVQNAIKMK